ncbi:MAG: hypothetical protein P0119_01645 [Nitrospira sp.]|nr:hypothetical protein [Nitrospira sp.]
MIHGGEQGLLHDHNVGVVTASLVRLGGSSMRQKAVTGAPSVPSQN